MALKSLAGSFSPQRTEAVPARSTVGFNTVNERLLFATQVMIGYTVEVQVTDGSTYEGILHEAQPSGKEISIVIKQSRKVRAGSGQSTAEPGPRRKSLTISNGELVQLLAKDVRLGAEDVGFTQTATFSTDAEISRGRGGLAGRELQRWAPEAGEALLEEGLGEGPTPGGRGGGRWGSVTGWDQFATNKERFQVETTWDEELYTTKLDRRNAGISEAAAARIAAEIEASSSNHHLAAERGQMDEEERYSAVVRSKSGGLPHVALAPEAAPPGSAPGRAPEALGLGPPSAMRREENGDATAPVRAAWTDAGASVAAVSGSSRWERPGLVRTAPVPVDAARRELYKVQEHLRGPKPKDRSSPYGTPKGGLRSPLSSPLIGNAIQGEAQVEALDLNPGAPRIDPSVRKEFEAFKEARQARSEAAPSMKSASADLGDSVRATSTQSSLSPPSQPPPSAPSSAPAPAPAPVIPSTVVPTPAPAPQPPVPVAPLVSRPPPPPAPAAATSPVPAAPPGPMPGVAPAPPTPLPPRKPSSKLNPYANAFSLNPAAKEFTPGARARPASAASPGASPADAAPEIGLRPGTSRASLGNASSGAASLDRAAWVLPRGPGAAHGHHAPHGPRPAERAPSRPASEHGSVGSASGPVGGPGPRGGRGRGPGGSALHAGPGAGMPAQQMHMGPLMQAGMEGAPWMGPPHLAGLPFMPMQGGPAFLMPSAPMMSGSPQQGVAVGYLNGGRPYGPGMPPQYLMQGAPGPYGLVYGPAPPAMGGPGARPSMYPGPGAIPYGVPHAGFSPGMGQGEGLAHNAGRGPRPASSDDPRWRK